MPSIFLYDDDDIEETEYTITHPCGSDGHPHTQVVYLSDLTSAAVREETLKVLRKTWCPDCHRRQHQLEVKQKTYAFGLLPLNDPDLRRVELAEEVRVRLVQLFIFSRTNLQAIKMLILLINRCLDISFWIEHRVILWDNSRLDPTLTDLRANHR